MQFARAGRQPPAGLQRRTEEEKRFQGVIFHQHGVKKEESLDAEGLAEAKEHAETNHAKEIDAGEQSEKEDGVKGDPEQYSET